MRTAVGTGVAVGLLAVLSAGCPWGATGSGGASGDQTPDDSAEAMVGTYRIESVATAGGDCDELETTEPDGAGTLRIERMDDEEQISETQLRVLVCRDGEACGVQESDAGGDVSGGSKTERRRQRARGEGGFDDQLEALTQASEAQGWTAEIGRASVVDGAKSARRCQLQWESLKLVPEKDGVRIERTRRDQVVTMEGDMVCRSGTAEAFGEELRCRDRTIWRGVSSPERG